MNRSHAVTAIGCVVAIALVALSYFRIRSGLHSAIVGTAGAGLFLVMLRARHRHEMASRVLVVAAAMPLLAWSLPNLWLVFGAMALLVPWVARRFDMLVPAYLFSLLLLPGLDVETGIGGLKLFDFGIHDALAVGTALAILLNPARARPQPASDVAVCALILLIGAALSRETTFSNFLRTSVNVVLDLGLPYYIVSRGLRCMDDLRTAMRWLACGGMALSALLIYEAARAWPIYNELYAIHRVPTLLLVKSRGGLLRSGGPFVEPTSAALVLAMCIVALWLLRDQFRSGAGHWLVLCVAFLGLSAPQSRGAWIGFCLAIGAADVLMGRYAALVRKVVTIAAAGSLAFLGATMSADLSESVGLSGSSSETSDYRRRLLARGMEEFWGSPLVGFSTPQLNVRLADLRQGEGIIDYVNTYIWIILISGSVGLAMFLGTFVYLLARIRRVARQLDDRAQLETAAFVFGCLAMLVEMLFFTSFGGRPAFLTFGLFGFAAALIASRDRVRKQARLPAPAQPSYVMA